MYKRVIYPVITILLLVLFGCATTPGRIDEDPSKYNGKTVKVRGRVEKIYKIPLTDISVFLLKDEETGVPVVSLSDREKEGNVVVAGRVWAFPEGEMNAGSVKAVEAMEEFLTENDIVSSGKAREVSAVILTAVRKLAAGLGEIWFIIEE